MLETKYDAAAIEPRIAGLWDEADAFRAGAGARPGGAPFSIVIPPPNVTGSLHMGHALNNTLQDILVRYHRMRGDDVLWQPGTDHAGIATQMVVERQMMERQEPNRRTIGRERFLEKVWAWKEESGGKIVNQLKRLGCSCDWRRERFTLGRSDADQMSRAVVKAFVDLHRQGLIYRDKRLVNWDPKLQTAISDLEVQQIEVKGNLWHLRYPIEGEPSRHIVVATTRPETMLGDTGVAVNPKDERYQDLVGRNVVLPLVGRRIPIVADDYADPEAGSGAVKVTPAHDFNDFEVGRRHSLPMVNLYDVESNLVLRGNDAFLDGVPRMAELEATIEALHGQDRFTARKRVVEMLEERGLVEKIEPYTHTVPHGDRSAVPIEPFLTDQWYVDAKRLAIPAIASVRDGRTAFVPKSWEKTYFDWMENIQPWCISRQLWWGHRIPAWYGPRKVEYVGHGYVGGTPPTLDYDSREIFVASSEAEAIAVARDYYGKEVAPIDRWQDADRSADGSAKQPIPLARDEDVLDTWFSSALWPFSTLGWPDQTPELDRYYPTATLVTGFDIIFFWVARMMMMGLQFRHQEPFSSVYIHGIVRDEKGAKMSKSKGNVVDPLGLIDEYGADALRFTMASLATPGRDVKPARARIEGYRNFASKLWQASRFAEINECVVDPSFAVESVKETANRWIATETARAVRAVSTAIEAFRFDEAAGAAYRFVWNLYCDWYIELIKPVLAGSDEPAKAETRATAGWVLSQILKLLHPFIPFVTEDLWSRLAKNADSPVLALSVWPEPRFEDPDAAAEINWLIGLVEEVRSVRSEMNVPPGALMAMVVSGASDVTRARLDRQDAVIRRLARASEIILADAPPAGSAQLIVGEATVSLPLEGIVDLAAERLRLQREIERLAKDIEKIDAKLGKADFVAKAPEEVVEEQRERRQEATERLAKLQAALSRIPQS